MKQELVTLLQGRVAAPFLRRQAVSSLPRCLNSTVYMGLLPEAAYPLPLNCRGTGPVYKDLSKEQQCCSN